MSAPAPLNAPPVKPLPLEDLGNAGLTSHLGLPFYYRHAPSPLLKRLGFYSVLLGLLLVTGVHALYFPYNSSTWQYQLKQWMFGGLRDFNSYEAGFTCYFYWMFIIAIIFSGIFAPLWATFSLAGERVMGTLEFLRLSPMSSTAIVMGKTFASAYPIHLFSAACLALGTISGLAAGLPITSIGSTILFIAASSAVSSALGVNVATMSTAFRGFSPLALWMVVGALYYMLPLSAVGGTPVNFLAYLSPWSAMDTLFWQAFAWRSNYGGLPEFLGSKTLALLFALGANGILFLLLTRSSARKLDDPDATIFSTRDYIILWVVSLAAAFGTMNNSSGIAIYRKSNEAAPFVILIAGLILVFTMLGDHPVRREKLLTRSLEYLSSTAQPRKAPPGLQSTGLLHALAVFFLALMTLGAFGALVYTSTNALGFQWDIYALFLVLTPLVMMLLSLCAELGGLFAQTPFFRFVCGFGASSICIAMMIGGFVYTMFNLEHFEQSLYCLEDVYLVEKGKPPKNIYRYRFYNPNADAGTIRTHGERTIPGFAKYTEGISSMDQTQYTHTQYRNAPFGFLLRYHALGLLFWVSLYLSMLAGLFFIRGWTYRRIVNLARLTVSADAG